MNNPITSVPKYLQAIKDLEIDNNHTLFYRGVSKEKYSLPEYNAPSIYRENYIHHEKEMYYELIARCPEYFKECKNTFDHLVMMQHYSYPTRLLDITSNPLVALFFACDDEKNIEKSNAKVMPFIVENKAIRNHESDRVSLLANLAKADNSLNGIEFIINTLQGVLEGHFVNHSFEKNIFQTFEEIIKNNTDKDVEHIYADISQELLNYMLCKEIEVNQNIPNHKAQLMADLKQITSNILVKIQRAKLYKNHFDPYAYHIKNERSGFNSFLINHNDLNSIQCVYPKQNNPRIIAQQGAFLLFGLKDDCSVKTDKPMIPYSLYAKNKHSKKKAEIIIPHEYKEHLLEELATLGISKASLFPEIDKIATELKERFKLFKSEK